MTPTMIHRYYFGTKEAVEALLGEAAGNIEAWSISVDGDELIIDVAPANSARSIEVPADFDHDKLSRMIEGGEFKTLAPGPGTLGANSIGSGTNSTGPMPTGELKGGPLAQRAGIMCGERGFWTFLKVDSADGAAAYIRQACGIETRALLDHVAEAAARFEEIDRRYRLWLEGYD